MKEKYYYIEIKKLLLKYENTEKCDDTLLNTYFDVGKLVESACLKFGDKIILSLSSRLMEEVSTKYSAHSLHVMKKYYEKFHK